MISSAIVLSFDFASAASILTAPRKARAGALTDPSPGAWPEVVDAPVPLIPVAPEVADGVEPIAVGSAGTFPAVLAANFDA